MRCAYKEYERLPTCSSGFLSGGGYHVRASTPMGVPRASKMVVRIYIDDYMEKVIWVVEPKENIFHCLPKVEHFESFEDWVTYADR